MKRFFTLASLAIVAWWISPGVASAQIPPEHLCEPDVGPIVAPQGLCGIGVDVIGETPGNCQAGVTCVILHKVWFQLCSSDVHHVTYRGQTKAASTGAGRVYFDQKYAVPACERAERPVGRFFAEDGTLLGLAILDFDCIACASPPGSE